VDKRSPDGSIDFLELEEGDPEPAPDAVSEILQSANEADPPEAGVMRAGEAGSVRNTNRQQWHIEEGTDVICSCGHKIGEVMDVQDDYLVVEKGFFITCDLYVPKTAVAGMEKDGLHLNISRHDADAAHWEHEPAISARR
jgi:hypothetical protein